MKLKRIFSKQIALLIFLTAFLLCGRTIVMAQSNPTNKSFTIVSGETLYDTLSSALKPVPKYNSVPNYTVTIGDQIGNTKRYPIEISFNANFIGLSTVTLEYYATAFPFGINPKYTVYSINVQQSVINIADRVILWDGTTSDITIDPFENVTATSQNLELKGIGQVMNGAAVSENGNIVYSPAQDMDSDVLSFTLTDEFGTSGIGRILIQKNLPDQSISAQYTISYLQSQLILLPNASYTLSTGNINGSLTQIGEAAFRYTPTVGFIGNQAFTFTKDSFLASFTVKVVSPELDGGIAKNDVIYTARNTTVGFNALTNDLSQNFPITWWSSDLIYLGSGDFSYTPPQNFEGTKNFKYRINYGLGVEFGDITIHVGNMPPTHDVEYRFEIAKNTPLVLPYEVPIQNYGFQIWNQSNHGSVAVFDKNDNIVHSCGEFSDKIGVIYQPEEGFVGSDLFDVRYCVNGSNCVVYKVYVEVLDVEGECPCLVNCVWSGDTNNDGRTSVADLLPIGRYLGYSGPSRPEENGLIWQGQFGDDWNTQTVSGTNLKHIDTDGDGFITDADAVVLAEKLNKVHNFVPAENLVIKDFPFELIPQSEVVEPGDLLVIDINIGNDDVDVVDIHGLAFGLFINPDFMDTTTLECVFDESSWFTRHSPSLNLVNIPSAGVVKGAFTRTSGIPISGKGKIGQLSFIVTEEVTGFKTEEPFIIQYINILDGIMEDGDGNKFSLPPAYVGIKLNLDQTSQTLEVSESDLIAFPNPASDEVQIHLNGTNHLIQALTLFNAMGVKVFENTIGGGKSYKMNTQSLQDGIYFLRCQSTKGVITKKIVIRR